MDKHRLFLQTYQKKAIEAIKTGKDGRKKRRIVAKPHTIKRHARRTNAARLPDGRKKEARRGLLPQGIDGGVTPSSCEIEKKANHEEYRRTEERI